MAPIPSESDLTQALAAAARAHHDYEQVVLAGQRDEQWAGFYAAFVLGRVGDFASPSDLVAWLRAAPASEEWAASAAKYVLSQR